MEWNGLRLMTAIKGPGIDPTTQASISEVFAGNAHGRMGKTAMHEDFGSHTGWPPPSLDSVGDLKALEVSR
jgi:hypothetical protein